MEIASRVGLVGAAGLADGQRYRQHASARHYLSHEADSLVGLRESASLTAKMFRFPMVQINVLDAHDQHTIAASGTALGSIPRADTLCDSVVQQGRPQVIHGSTGPGSFACIQSYIGVPIVGREGLVIGSLCLLDTVWHPITDRQLQDLQTVAVVVQDQLELRRRLGPTPAGSIADTSELSRAIEDGQIMPFFQPIVDLRSGRTVGVEALARWHNPAVGLIGPAGFIPLAEDSDLIIDLDLAVLRSSAVSLRRWQRSRPELRLNVNLSARHFDHPDCVHRLTQAVLDAGVDPCTITFEVTETGALAAHPGDRSFLADLRARGFRVVLDDFGMGFSSVEQVLRLPVDGIKLDRAVSRAAGSTVGDALLRALLGLAADLELDSVLEGIETGEQADRARRFGCAHGQGYYYARPRPAAETELHLDR